MRFTRMSQKAALGLALVGIMALSAQAATITLSVNPTTTGGDLLRVVAGDNVWFELAVDVDAAAGSSGLATLVYNVLAQQTTPQLSGMLDAFSGYRNDGTDVLDPPDDGQAVVSENYYRADANNTLSPSYGGGWGFDRAGLPGGGDVTSNAGDIEAAGATAPLTWTADNHPVLAGLQPKSRLNIGIGAFTFGDDDPVLGGVQGGFGFEEVVNAAPTPGTGEWIIQVNHIDTTGWAPGTYAFDIVGTAGAVYDGTLDYTTDIAGGFRVDVPSNDMTGTSFSFTIIPEPATLGLLLLGGLSMVRRRRQ